jgi:hypothetical protein
MRSALTAEPAPTKLLAEEQSQQDDDRNRNAQQRCRARQKEMAAESGETAAIPVSSPSDVQA